MPSSSNLARIKKQAPKLNKIPVIYYGVSMDPIPPEQDPRPSPLEVFYIAHDVIDGCVEYTGVKISPAFRTVGEAFAYRDTCGIDGAYCLETALRLRNDAERAEYALKIFG